MVFTNINNNNNKLMKITLSGRKLTSPRLIVKNTLVKVYSVHLLYANWENNIQPIHSVCPTIPMCWANRLIEKSKLTYACSYY